MILSIPNTISKKVRVSKLIHTLPDVKSGIVIISIKSKSKVINNDKSHWFHSTHRTVNRLTTEVLPRLKFIILQPIAMVLRSIFAMNILRIMKFSTIALVFLSAFTILRSQTTFAKYVLVEHFTNTWCPICAGRNPDFYSTIQKYPKNVHQISIHPPYPYSGCPLYQYNKTENQERSNYYNLLGTPTVILNGGSLLGGSPLLTEDALKKEIAKTSPLSVLVTESGSGNNRVANITLKPNGAINGDLRLVAIIVERNLKFTASNGEIDHFNVMRRFLTPVTGQKISITDASEKKYVFNWKDSTGWKPEEAYVLAFVQNAGSNEVINSGTKFDNLATPVVESKPLAGLKVYPTVSKEYINIEMPSFGNSVWEIINVHGQIIQHGAFHNLHMASLPVIALSQGVYWIRISQSDNQVYTAKFVKG